MSVFFTTLAALFSVVNPLGAMPVFLALTANDPPEWRNAQLKKATIYLAGILVVFFLVGNYILTFFNLSIDALRIAGGLIITSSGFDLLATKEDTKGINDKVREEALVKSDISFSPLAMPMLAGPGSISLLISKSLEISNYWHYLGIIAAIVAVALIAYLILRVAPKLVVFLGESGIAALSRMMGFLVLAIGIQFIANGITPMIKQAFAGN